jgi:C4-dicarboxylate-specific signal transduction histidine kinase
MTDKSIIAAMPFGVLQLDMRNAWPIVKALPDFEKASPIHFLEQHSVCALANSSFIQSSNAAAFLLTGQESDNHPVPIAAILHTESHRKFADALWNLMDESDEFSFDVILQHKSGKEIHALANLWRLPGPIWTGDVYLSLTNITRRVTSEESKEHLHHELAHASRISLLGEMTASIAHEINQPLSSVVTNAEAGLRWLQRDVPDLVEVSSILERIVKNGNRAADIITTMKAMSRNGKTHRAPLQINDIVQEAVLILRSEISKRQVGLRLELSADLPLAAVDRTQILQVVVNLALNAAQAMADGQAWNRTLKVRTRHDGDDFIAFEVEDSGPGVDPAVRERLFESFYTTKDSGVGIGLSICRSIVEAHGGSIELISSPNLGARFNVRLPVTGTENMEPHL